MDIGEKITYYRKKKNYSVNRLANLAGISQSYLRDIELGNKNPTIEFLSYICEALDISLKDFFDDATPSLLDNPLICRVYQLSPKQKEALLTFLDTLLPNENGR